MAEKIAASFKCMHDNESPGASLSDDFNCTADICTGSDRCPRKWPGMERPNMNAE